MRKTAIFFLILILIGTFIPIPFLRADGENWLTGWDYRKSHTIEGTTEGAQTNYQIKITVHYGAGADTDDDVYLNDKSKTDFGDIRFTKADGDTELDYWIQEKIDSNYAIFWVEVDSIPDDPNDVDIYIYYGKDDATTTSNGFATFVWFDDFEDDDHTDKWTSNTGTWVETGGFLKQTNNAASFWPLSGDHDGIETKNPPTIYERRVSVKMRLDDSGGGRYTLYTIKESNSENVLTIALRHADTVVRVQAGVGGSWKTIYNAAFAASLQTFYRIESTITSGGRITLSVDGIQKISQTHADFNQNWNVIGVYTHNSKLSLDDFFVGKYCSPEPSHGEWGSEETEEIGNGDEIIIVESDAPWIAIAIILSIVSFLLATEIRR